MCYEQFDKSSLSGNPSKCPSQAFRGKLTHRPNTGRVFLQDALLGELREDCPSWLSHAKPCRKSGQKWQQWQQCEHIQLEAFRPWLWYLSVPLCFTMVYVSSTRRVLALDSRPLNASFLFLDHRPDPFSQTPGDPEAAGIAAS